MKTFDEIVGGSAPTLVEFYATWCPHCTKMAPIVEDLKKRYDGRANIVQYDGDEHPDLMKRCRINSYPGWVLFKDGQEVWRDMGEKPESELADMIDRFI